MISAIVCADSNNGIGYQNHLLIRIPEDMKRFKAFTSGHIIIMGNHTWKSLSQTPLPERCNFVILHDYKKIRFKKISNSTYQMGINMKTAKHVVENCVPPCANAFVIGGAQIYKELLPYCDRIYLTRILYEFPNVDAYFPDIDSSEWHCTSVGAVETYSNLNYRFETYDRIKSRGENE